MTSSLQAFGAPRRAQAGAARRRFEPKPMQLDESAVRDAYRRWAPVYDYTFGAVSTAGRRHAVEIINGSSGRVLEVGVGTGLALPDYRSTSISSASISHPRCSKRPASASKPKVCRTSPASMKWMPAT